MSLLGLLLASQLVVTVANRPPVFDIEPTCRATMGDGLETLQGCESDERDAGQQLAKQWSQFSDSERAMCTDLTNSFDPSYVELFSCLDMMREAKSPTSGQK
jgi:hypothetical protein